MSVLDLDLRRKRYSRRPWIREHVSCSAVCVCHFDPNSRRERMADSDGISQLGAGTLELETSEVRTGSGVGGSVPRIEGIL